MRKVGIKKVLTAFGKDVIVKAKKNLRLSKISTKGHLANGMNSEAKINSSSVDLNITIAGYWEFIDYGVKGVGGTRKYKDGKKLKNPEPWNKKRVTNNKFKYKKHQPPASAFSRYTTKRGGQFAIAKSVFHTGLKTTSFFTDAFKEESKELETNLLQASVDSSLNSLINSFKRNKNITIITVE